MPRRQDLETILILGSGPIVIGQACEFDYSGTQACKALVEDGFRIVLINSNPATIMTDPEIAHRTYIEPITPEIVEMVIEKERPDAVLPTLGGQTALNTAMILADRGVFEKYGVEMIGADRNAIAKAEGRKEFSAAMENIGLEMPRSQLAYGMDEAMEALDEIGLPCVIRPGFTLGGTGGGIAYNLDEFKEIARRGLDLSMNSELLIDECIVGWKEYELEVMRDNKDNVVIICSIENFDAMGVHTGDSITVAPAQTLTDREYQLLRDGAIKVIREIGVDTGGSNVQFAVNPKDGRVVIIEMNPRVSRSSALASKATGYPIAKIAAQLAVGYTLDELQNSITQKTTACFEPSIDYCVVKFPRWAFEKFPTADSTLTTQMKSVGEAMAIGRTFKEAMQKAMRSLEIGRSGIGNVPGAPHSAAVGLPLEEIRPHLTTPRADRMDWIRSALVYGMSVEDINEFTGIDTWFLDQLQDLVDHERLMAERGAQGIDQFDEPFMRQTKRLGFSDPQIAASVGCTDIDVRNYRKKLGVVPTYKLVDTCAAEFESYTPYLYSTYEGEDEVVLDADKQRVMVLGGGPNRIGQGIEFDYCCVHASMAIRDLGYHSVMVNSNPETVSTDFDTSDLLFFEPLTLEDVLNIVDRIDPKGIIVQFGGQTPLNLARGLADAGAPLIGTSVDNIEAAEDRDLFAKAMHKLDLLQPPNGMASSLDEATEVAQRVGFPVVIRPSFVLGGRAMQVVYDEKQLDEYMAKNADVANGNPFLVDKFVDGAIEVDVDAISDGETVVVGGIMEHIEEAGVHSGDSSCSLPPYTLSDKLTSDLVAATEKMAKEFGVVGLMNIQFAIQGSRIFVLEANPRASRTVPFVSKSIGKPLAKIAAKLMLGDKLAQHDLLELITPEHFSVKAPVFPFNKFVGIDTLLGPEMQSTGEVMGVDKNFGAAFAKAQIGAGNAMPEKGAVFISVRDEDKRFILSLASRIHNAGLEIVATRGTARALSNNGIPVEVVSKIHEGRPNVLDLIKNRQIQLIINTPSGRMQRSDDNLIRSNAVTFKIPCITTLAAASATIQGLEWIKDRPLSVCPIQDHQATLL